MQASPMRATDAVAAADEVEMSAMLGQLLSQAGNPESKSAVQVSSLEHAMHDTRVADQITLLKNEVQK